MVVIALNLLDESLRAGSKALARNRVIGGIDPAAIKGFSWRSPHGEEVSEQENGVIQLNIPAV
ncbi:MAG: hypothetical protein CBC13_05835, partial [Planctomycetia bacterium TMED53]